MFTRAIRISDEIRKSEFTRTPLNVYKPFHYSILMRFRSTLVESEDIYFLTATLVNGLPVIIGEVTSWNRSNTCRL